MLRSPARILAALLGMAFAASVASALAALSLKRRAPLPQEPDDDQIDFVTIMDSGQLASTAGAFRGGRIVCWYAGVDVDLRGATLDPAGASLEVRTAFGGTRIVVAPGVPVRVSVPAVFGGSSNDARALEAGPGAPGLEIHGFTVFGGLQVLALEPGASLDGSDRPPEVTDLPVRVVGETSGLNGEADPAPV